ncbi:MAG: putative cytochrome P450 135B1 [Chlamydiae bacterium]|nr:putative cytochrome P450 135B1 [Chlamydiota bacterium]
MKIPDGPKLPMSIQGLLYTHNPYKFLMNCRKKYGKIFTIKVPALGPTVVACDPEELKQIFSGDPDEVRAGEATSLFSGGFFGKHSLLTLDGEAHWRHRKILSPPMHGKNIRNYGKCIIDSTTEVMSRWKKNKFFPILTEFQSITLQVIMSKVFGFEMGATSDAFQKLMTRLMNYGEPALSYIVGVFPTMLDHFPKTIKKTIAEMDKFLYEQIRFRRRDPTEDEDLLSTLIHASDEEGRGLSDEELRDELLTLLFAGHDTTAGTCAWTIYYILSNPKIYEKVMGELDQVLEGEKEERISLEKIKNLDYLMCVIKETQRYRPILPTVFRMLNRSFKIGDYEIPKGYAVGSSVYLAGMDGEYWDNPTEFVPERFYSKTNKPYQYCPFGGGRRRCVGADFALFEMPIILAHVLNRFNYSLKRSYLAKPVPHIATIIPSKGVPVIIR